MTRTTAKGSLSSSILKRSLSRRSVLQGLGGAAASAGMTAAFPGHVSAFEPRRGGRLRVGLAHGSTTDSLDPATYSNGFTSAINFAVHNHLGELNESGELVPELAESWEIENGGREWIFQLRKGVEFHNGKTLDADDVIASINYHRGETKSPTKVLLTDIESIEKLDLTQIQVKLARADVYFPYRASEWHIPILPARDGTIDVTAGGTGGYTLEQWQPGVRAVLVRNPNYFKTDRAWFDEVELITIFDTAARQAALITGQVDVMDQCDLKTLGFLREASGVSIKETSGTLHYTFPMLTNVAPFDNNDVRLALKYAVDRQALLDIVLQGHGSIGNDQPIGSWYDVHSSDIEQRKYDPDKARYHLNKAGLSRLDVQLHVAEAAFLGATDAASIYREHAKRAGIEIDVVREPNDGYWSNVWRKEPWSACYWVRPTADELFSVAYASDAVWNDTNWHNERFSQLLVYARAELDESKRREMYAEMQSLVRDFGGQVIPLFPNFVFAASDRVGHGTMAADRDLDGRKFVERWWFAGA